MEGPRRKALGRGLGALIPGAGRQLEGGHAGQAAGGGAPASSISMDSIRPNRLQPRTDFPEETIEQLASSILQNGVIQPIMVRPVGDGYELIAGERRFRAAQRAGLSDIPAVIKEASDREALELAIVENVQREDLNPLDEAAAYQRLMDEFGLTQEGVAERVGKSRPAVANSLRLLSLPLSVQAEIRAGRLPAGHARAVAGARSAEQQVRAAQEIVSRRLNARQAEKLVRDMAQKAADPDHSAVEERLRRALGTKVRLIAKGNGSGRIEIDFFSLEELDGLLERIAGTS